MTPGTRIIYYQRYGGGNRGYLIRAGTCMRLAGKTRVWVRLDSGRETCVPRALVEVAGA